MNLKTELGKFLYDYLPLKKSEIKTSVLTEIAESWCARHGLELREIEMVFNPTVERKIHIVHVSWAEPQLLLYETWRRAFSDHGYLSPCLDIEERTYNEIA